ncbi:MAG: UDP-N-acetylmuramoyl-tripeptide--D-alanyl-D-alanine ligase, partial [Methylococcales bacterium]|nr:UDP-N-acetylmuramoyl-tripeptide--D-alanyl-D-alanine ligase [Methylococcales bacterium]
MDNKKMLTLETIAVALKANLRGRSIAIDSVSIDSRRLKAGALYIAIKGDRFDGHDFVQAAEKKGAGALLVNQLLESDLPQLVVEDTRLSLAQLGGVWRQESQAT